MAEGILAVRSGDEGTARLGKEFQGKTVIRVHRHDGTKGRYLVDEVEVAHEQEVRQGDVIGYIRASQWPDEEPKPDPEPDMVNHPPHYKFSNGAEVIDISENLTSNAGQAVQYIARSSRIDGNNKGDTLEDLQKARWFIDREIERVQQQGDTQA